MFKATLVPPKTRSVPTAPTRSRMPTEYLADGLEKKLRSLCNIRVAPELVCCAHSWGDYGGYLFDKIDTCQCLTCFFENGLFIYTQIDAGLLIVSFNQTGDNGCQAYVLLLKHYGQVIEQVSCFIDQVFPVIGRCCQCNLYPLFTNLLSRTTGASL